jgi:Domain of unknown function (DUF1963)
VDRQQVVSAARAVGLGEWAEALAREARPSIRLVPGHVDGHAFDSRLGGVPALPAGHAWPMSQGEPQSFIGQIRLDEIADAAGFGLPADGTLSFFFDAGQRPWSDDPVHRGAWQVTWFPPGTPLEIRPWPDGLDRAARFTGRAVTGVHEWTVPPWDSPEMDRVALPQAFGQGRDIASDGFEDLQDRLSATPGQPRHRMFGFPDQIAGDMRLWLDGVSGAEDAPGPEWQLFLQVDSDEPLGTYWGDEGRIYYWITRDALAARAFDRTWLDLQCY